MAALNHAAALARRDGPEQGLAALEALADLHPALGDYQPFWALRADLCARVGKAEEARVAYDEAIVRESDPAVIAFLEQRRASLG